MLKKTIVYIHACSKAPLRINGALLQNITQLMRMLADIVEKYGGYNFLREIIAEIDIYGVDDYICGMKKPEGLINASTDKCGYDF